jgi:hypothetical protein
MKYLIWSIEHQQWWKPKLFGYTENVLFAGRFDKADADKIVSEANRSNQWEIRINEISIPEECVNPSPKRIY